MAAEERDLNRDPITDEPGAHPLGTGVGATGGAMAGAAVGAVGGPVGIAVGSVVGAVAGGLAGKAAAEAVNPTAEEAYWRENYTREPYYQNGRSFDEYSPAYMLGVNGRARYEDSWDAAEPRLASEWETARGGSSLSWPEARLASMAAWSRIESRHARNDTTVDGDGYAAGNSVIDNDEVIETLDDLAETSKDGEYGFRACAEQADRQDLKTLFLKRAEDCNSAAQELYQQIRSLGGKPDDGGTTAGAMHRGWVSVKAAFSTYDDKAVLEEAERGEDHAKKAYTKALQKPLPANIKQLLERQLQGLQRNHDQVKMLRDQARAAS